ncbi:protein kinase, ATP binding site-containing protein [Tanacetum coccineum]
MSIIHSKTSLRLFPASNTKTSIDSLVTAMKAERRFWFMICEMEAFSTGPPIKLTWAHDLKICIGAAKGLKYLHSGLGEYDSVIHEEFSSANILISDNLEAKICGLGSSFLVHRNYPDTKVYKKPVGSREGILSSAQKKKMKSLISDGFGSYATRAPSTLMGRSLQHQKLEDFLIPLSDINLAIGLKGQETQIGDGGFGVVYRGQPLERWQNRRVAIKCLRPESYQGEYEFRNELNMIFSFNHENIIPFIGYCDEGNEKIIVYEYASNGSLDCHLKDKEKRRFLTWEHRLKICLGAARGLDYLHSGLGEDNRVIHRDVKSANILLDHNFVAKVCDFGLSKSGPINQPHTQVYTNAAGTNFYTDPVYHESGVLRKESDVYSFGVVMFELLSGMLAYNRRRLEGGKPKPLLNIVRRYYDYKPDLIIDPLIRDEIDSRSFNVFREVAFQCISFNSKERPTMEALGDRLEEALELQVNSAPKFNGAVCLNALYILMFELLIGMVANEQMVMGDYKSQRLINIVRRCYDNRPEQLIDPFLRDHIDPRSFHMFIDIAYRCISFNLKDRPTMDEVVKTIKEALDIHRVAKSIELMDGVAKINGPKCKLLLLRTCACISKLYFAMRKCSPRDFERGQQSFDVALRSTSERIVTRP